MLKYVLLCCFATACAQRETKREVSTNSQSPQNSNSQTGDRHNSEDEYGPHEVLIKKQSLDDPCPAGTEDKLDGTCKVINP